VFPGKAFCTQCTEEEFGIGQVLRCSGMIFCISSSSNPCLRCISLPVSDFVRFPSSWNFGRKKLMRENRDMTLSWRGGRG
jgi:hypothetical protein